MHHQEVTRIQQTRPKLLRRIRRINSLLITESVEIRIDSITLQGCTSLPTRHEDRATRSTDHVEQGGTRINLSRQVVTVEHRA
jgi:hypothetical protein